MHYSCAWVKIPEKLGGESHRLHAHAKLMIMRRHERSHSPNVHVTHEIHGRNDTNACKNDYEKYFFMRMPPNMSYHAMAWIYHAARLDRVWFVKVSNLSYTYAIQKIQKVWSIGSTNRRLRNIVAYVVFA